MKLLIMGSVLILFVIARSTENRLLVPATGTLMKNASQNNNTKTIKTKPVSATGTMFIYSNN
ncbi:MAG: hypothetical protein RR191_01905 [Cetobacterium sp.]|uniref:hypothetical protein n=1 Tax=unclassified Cetobacterium TaxID=2630983 RepID=UPI00163BE1AC|nr:hypothetical protein [Cetobacterium sp. 2A]MBC2855804.1 hypothetical protein [Cetobacterium sp. 2A]